MNKLYLIVKNIIKYLINLHLIRYNYNVINVINSTINSKYNYLNNTEKIAITHDFTRGNFRVDSDVYTPTTEYVARTPAHQCFK